ncbi:MAG: hypothetical protein QNJ40_10050 [Xanthomonadales bacterium]|nr:hypothetical protein [Xanthomonadales bacterium]
MHKAGIATLVIWVCLVMATGAMAEPHIAFSRVPPPGAGPDSRGDIAGTVSGVENPDDYKVVIYARAHLWYVQPTIENPHTSIGADGDWKTWTHLGDRYAALLVKPSYRPPSTPGSLPEVGDDVLAIATKDAKALR